MNRLCATIFALASELISAPVRADTPCASAPECMAELRALKDQARSREDPQRMAARAYFLGGNAVLADLAQLISAKNADVVDAATRLLGAAGPEAAAFFPQLAREFAKQHSAGDQGEFSAETACALWAIDHQRALPLLKAAAVRGHHAAIVCLDGNAPDALRALVRAPRSDELVRALVRLVGRFDIDHSRGLYELAQANPKLNMATKDKVDEALRLVTLPRESTEDAETALANIETLLADPDRDKDDRSLARHFHAVVRDKDQAVALVPRLLAWQENPATAARATWALGEIPAPAAQAALRSSLARQDNWRVVLLAANALARQGETSKDALGPLRTVAKSHWHPRVRAEAERAVQTILGQASTPEPVEALRSTTDFGPSVEHWGASLELLSDGFHCSAPRAWQEPVAPAKCLVPGTTDQNLSCLHLLKMDAGVLFVDPSDDDSMVRNSEPKSTVRFSPKDAASPQSTVGQEGFFRAITGQGTRAFAVEIAAGRSSFEAVEGPGRTWLAGFEQRASAWVATGRVELPAGLTEVVRLDSGIVRLSFATSDLILGITPDGQILSGDCRPDPLAQGVPGLAVLQALFDDPALQTRLRAAGAPTPLHVAFAKEKPDGADRLRFEGQAIVLDNDDLAIAAGRVFTVENIQRAYDRDERRQWLIRPRNAVVVTFHQRAMYIDESVEMRPEAGTWEIVPPTLKAAARPALPPPDELKPPRDALQTESGLSFKVLKSARDALRPATLQSTVNVEITGWSSDGQLFYPRTGKAPARVDLPLLLTMEGLAEGIVAMRIGEKRRLWIPAALAQAKPAGSPDLVFDVTLLEIDRDTDAQDDFPAFASEADVAEALRAPSELKKPPKSAKSTKSGLKYRVASGKPRPPSANSQADSQEDETIAFQYRLWNKAGQMVREGAVGQHFGGLLRTQGTAAALLIPGIAEALRLTRPGAKYHFWIPTDQAHGDAPLSPSVPAGKLFLELERKD